MQAWAGHVEIQAIFRGFGEANVPAHDIVWNIIDRLAGPQTVLTPDTFIKVNHHMPLMFGGGFFFAMSLATDTLNSFWRKWTSGDHLGEHNRRTSRSSDL
jgi:hypothetical protein